MPLDFKIGQRQDAFVDSGAYVSAIPESEQEKIKQQAASNIFEVEDPSNFRMKVANGSLEKPVAIAIPMFDFKSSKTANHFVVVKKITRPILMLRFRKHISPVLDTTYGPIHFPHLAMQIKALTAKKCKTPIYIQR